MYVFVSGGCVCIGCFVWVFLLCVWHESALGIIIYTELQFWRGLIDDCLLEVYGRDVSWILLLLMLLLRVDYGLSRTTTLVQLEFITHTAVQTMCSSAHESVTWPDFSVLHPSAYAFNVHSFSHCVQKEPPYTITLRIWLNEYINNMGTPARLVVVQ